jgi:hypothetical protein
MWIGGVELAHSARDAVAPLEDGMAISNVAASSGNGSSPYPRFGSLQRRSPVRRDHALNLIRFPASAGCPSQTVRSFAANRVRIPFRDAYLPLSGEDVDAALSRLPAFVGLAANGNLIDFLCGKRELRLIQHNFCVFSIAL